MSETTDKKSIFNIDSILSGANEGMKNIPFTHLISEPLKACVIAQNESAKTTLEAMESLGLLTDKDKNKAAVCMEFEFINQGRIQKLMVPLLTLVPINFIQIDRVNIKFKASVRSSTSYQESDPIQTEIAKAKKEAQKETKGTAKEENEQPDKKDEELGFNWATLKKVAAKGWDLYKEYEKSKNKEKESGTEYSNKKDSVATQESKYSIETTVDFDVQASNSHMPAGLAKVLEILGGTVSVFDPKGELVVTEKEVFCGEKVYISYRNEQGVFDAEAIKYTPEAKVERAKIGDGVLLTFKEKGSYVIKAGQKEEKIEVKAKTNE